MGEQAILARLENKQKPSLSESPNQAMRTSFGAVLILNGVVTLKAVVRTPKQPQRPIIKRVAPTDRVQRLCGA